MRTADRVLPFAGTEEELERYLLEFASLVGGRIGRIARPEPAWVAAGGALLSSNPNTVPWTLRVRRDGAELRLSAEVRSLPWTRAKLARLAKYRCGQLADYLTARVRGSGPEKFGALPFREPFAPYGSGVAALTASYFWMVLAGLAAFVAALAAVTLASVPFLAGSIADVAARSAALQAAGAIPLPSPAEAAATGPWLASLVFAAPVAFFLALVHSGALAACDLSPRAARLPQASFLFQAILLGLAYLPFVPALSPLIAFGVPTAVHLGSTFVWARRRERIRDGPRPAKAVIIIAIALSASVAGAAMPRVTEWNGALDRLALFRDAWLLGNPAGKAVASSYYRFTLYSAEPIKEFYSASPGRARKAQPIARSTDPRALPPLRALHFTVVPQGPVADVVVDGGVAAGTIHRSLRDPRDPAELKSALDEVSRDSFRGARMRELCALAWHAVYYAGPPAVLLLATGAFAPFVSLLFRRLRPQAALFALSACAIVASLTLVLLTLPGDEVPDLAEDLKDARAAVRHEAAFRASRLDSTASLAEPLLGACDDPDFRIRLWAVAALGRSGDPRAYAKLVERLDDSEIFVRYRAAEGLGSLRDPRAVPALVRLMRERSWYEGAYALEALRRIQPGVY